jgi:predicted amidophosphoribosyltransferase
MNKCPHCGEDVRWDEVSCPCCGYKLRDAGPLEDDLLSAEEENDHEDYW